MGDYSVFVKRVYEKTGINLAEYKETQMKRRLTSFRDREGYKSFSDMLRAFGRDTSLLERFLNRITINVSEFFRNPERWRVLEEEILPQIAMKHPHLKCWSAACSNGEEPYSLAMVLEKLSGRSYELLATDIDRRALQNAQLGEYDEASLRHLSPQLKAKYLSPIGGNRYRMSDHLKRRIQFERHNLLSDPYPKGCHLIVCRNVMIYFTDEAKDRIYRRFSESLVPGGVLFVGSTEQILKPANYNFSPVSPFFYERV